MSDTILIIDADTSLQGITDTIQNTLRYRVVKTASCQEALDWIHAEKQPQPSLILLCASELPAKEKAFMRSLREIKPQISVIAVLPYGSDDYASTLMQEGVSHYITKPAALENVRATLDITLRMQKMNYYIAWLERRVAGHIDFSDLIGNHPLLKEAMRLGRQAAQSSVPVWIEGETGSGKELLARAIHGNSSRAAKPFVVVNCAMLSEQSADAMLFGSEKNASPSQSFILGKIREAEGGTLLLDEIGALPSATQQRLSDFFSSKTIMPLGGMQKIPANIRIISTTSTAQTLLPAKELASHTLYQKLKALMISVPSLKQRKDDIPMLAEHFMSMYSATERKYIRAITPAAMEWLSNQSWPGNVHEFAHVLQRAIILCRKDTLDISDLMASVPVLVAHNGQSVAEGNGWLDANGRMKPLKSVQEEAIRFALEHSDGCMTRAAKSLGIGRSTLYRKLGEFSRSSYTSRANQTTRPMTNVSSGERS